jgi:hypothetical protein
VISQANAVIAEWTWKKSNNLLRASFILISCILIGRISHAAIEGDTSIHQHLRKFKFVFALDGKKSFIATQRVNIFGVKVGFQYKNKFRAGLSLHGLSKPAPIKAPVNKGTVSEKIVDASLDFSYLSVVIEPIFLKTKKWELSAPMHLGSGTASLSYMDSSTAIPQEKLINEKKTNLLEVSFVAEYKLLRWLGFGAGIGYRQMLTPDDILRKNFNGPIYLFKVKIYFHEIYNMIFKERKRKKEAEK